jgi:hypothetical protein
MHLSEHIASRRSRRGVTGAALLVAGTVMLVPTTAQGLVGSSFEIDTDANLKVDQVGWVDWASLAHASSSDPEKRALDLATGRTDDSYAGGVKEDTECPGETTGSIPNNKSDLLSFHVNTEEGAGSHPGYLNLAWSRVSEPSGTTLMDFEFNQANVGDPETACAQGPNVARTVGDLLIEYAIDQGGAKAAITMRRWSGTAWGTPELLTDPDPDCGGDPCAEGSINSTAIPAAESDGLIATGQKNARTFGEAQIDLRTIFDPDQCSSFGAAMLKSRSSDSFTSQLKDFIRPIPITLQNCGKVVIRKVTQPAGSSESFTFGKSFGTSPATPDSFSLTGAAPGNVKTFDKVLFGSGYTVEETQLPAGWEFVGIDCSASTGVTPVLAGRTVTFEINDETDVLDCTYTNRASATLRIDKVTDPAGDPQEFTFVPGAGLPAGNVLLADGTTPHAYSSLSPGPYTVTEQAPGASWDLTAIACRHTASSAAKAATVDLAARSVTVSLGAGDDVTCAFANRKRGSLEITKTDDADPAAVLAGAAFTLYDDVAPVGGTRGAEDTATAMACATGANGKCSVDDIPVGSYWVVETTTPPGHATAPDQHLVVTAGSSLSRSFVDPREFTVITLVCRNSDSSLYPSSVTLGGQTEQSLGEATAFATEAELCSLGGARFTPRQRGVHNGSVTIPQ